MVVNYSCDILAHPFFLRWIKLVVINYSSLRDVVSRWVVGLQLVNKKQIILGNLAVFHVLDDFHLAVEVSLVAVQNGYEQIACCQSIVVTKAKCPDS